MTRIADWWKKVQLPFKKWRVVVSVEAADEIPPLLPEYGAAVVRSAGRAKWLAFDCPCGKGHRIMLNLDPSRRPVWRLVNDSPLTVSPSVDDQGLGRSCHFFIERGRVLWVRTRTRTHR